MFKWLWNLMGWELKEVYICKDEICRKETFWQKKDKTPAYISMAFDKLKSYGYEIK